VAGRHNNIETALCEALHLVNVERNADIVRMTSYAPLLARHGHANWNPDMIYFNSSRIDLTPGYYTQKIFGNNSGDKYITNNLRVESRRDDVRKRVATSAVYDSETILLLYKTMDAEYIKSVMSILKDKYPTAIAEGADFYKGKNAAGGTVSFSAELKTIVMDK
jgi:hypothetical protein